MLTRPWIRLSSCSSCCSLTELAVGLTCCALAGAAMITRSSAHAPNAKRMNLPNDVICASSVPRPRLLPASGLDGFAICGLPAPRAGAVAARHHAFLVNLGNDLTVTCEQRLGRAHFSTQR